jgi:hypothetical protein
MLVAFAVSSHAQGSMAANTAGSYKAAPAPVPGAVLPSLHIFTSCLLHPQTKQACCLLARYSWSTVLWLRVAKASHTVTTGVTLTSPYRAQALYPGAPRRAASTPYPFLAYHRHQVVAPTQQHSTQQHQTLQHGVAVQPHLVTPKQGRPLGRNTTATPGCHLFATQQRPEAAVSVCVHV